MDPKRLDAVPWAPYCIRHQKLLDAASRPHPNALNPNENRSWLPAVPRVRALVRRFAELPRRLSSGEDDEFVLYRGRTHEARPTSILLLGPV